MTEGCLVALEWERHPETMGHEREWCWRSSQTKAQSHLLEIRLMLVVGRLTCSARQAAIEEVPCWATRGWRRIACPLGQSALHPCCWAGEEQEVVMWLRLCCPLESVSRKSTSEAIGVDRQKRRGKRV